MIDEISPMVRMEQGIPAAVGSARQASCYKMHAACHSERLVVPDWASVAEAMNTTRFWVGDLAESKINQSAFNLKDLLPRLFSVIGVVKE